jgi:class 3 adenylate cyclase/tetratricopeptide (TPR) repeat protein
MSGEAPSLDRMTCSVCGETLPDGARFCPNCGAPVPTLLATDERKMVTVLFADLVDSTGLARRFDAERAREILGRFFDMATEELFALRGRPEKFIGDAVMAVFGVPTVDEEDALRAVRAGLAIRGRLRRLSDSLGLSDPLEVRVGIDSGEAATGLGPAGQLLVTGSVVNAAARLQVAAEPGEVLVGPTTFALTDVDVTYGPRREVGAKGFGGNLAAFSVIGLSTRSRRRTIPFVGRQSELTILRESLARVSSTGRPTLVTVLGGPGIGKSRLADELVAGVGDDVTVGRGLAHAFTDTATFAPAAAIVGDLARVDESDAVETIRRRLRELVARTKGSSAASHLVERLSLLFGSAEHVAGSGFVQAVQAGVVELIEGLTRDRAFVLIFEDGHRLKPAMLDLVERLAAAPRSGPRRALLVVLARPELLEQRPRWASNTANAVTIRLDPLTLEESIDLAQQAAAERIEEEEATRIAIRADGNPFFIVETTGMLMPQDGGSPSPIERVPPTVQAVVAARLDALPSRLRELARHASIFFVSFDLDELHVVDPDATLQEVRGLEEAEILVREEGHGTVPRWRVRHSMVKDVAYSSLPKRQRVRLHHRVADHLHDHGHESWAADHLYLAGLASLDLDPDDRMVAEPAADALIRAGDRARRRTESRSAIDYYERCLSLSGPDDSWGVREARALAGMGEAHYWLGEYQAAAERAEHAVRLGTRLDDPFTLALALRFLGDIALNIEGDIDRAEELLDRSLVSAEELGDPWAIVRTLLFAGWVPSTRKEYDKAEATFRRVLELAAPDDGWARARALNSLSVITTNQQAALRLSEEATAVAERFGDPFSVAMTSVQRARILEELGRFQDALPCLESAVATFDDLGARWELADATAERGQARRGLGQLDASEDDLRRALHISEELGELQLRSWLWRSLAKVSEERGDERQAEERWRRSREADEWRSRALRGRPAMPRR